MNIRRIRQLTLTAVACTLASLAPAVFGQDVSAKITGTVTDASGAVISGASVTATEKSRGTVYPAETNSAGVYYLSPLPIGDYVLKVSAAGFSSVERPSFLAGHGPDRPYRYHHGCRPGLADRRGQRSAAITADRSELFSAPCSMRRRT